jgi:hypothetical protein
MADKEKYIWICTWYSASLKKNLKTVALTKRFTGLATAWLTGERDVMPK